MSAESTNALLQELWTLRSRTEVRRRMQAIAASHPNGKSEEAITFARGPARDYMEGRTQVLEQGDPDTISFARLWDRLKESRE